MAERARDRVLVTGATGLTGSYFVRRLAERETPFRALVRDPRRGQEIQALGGQVHLGDLRRPVSLRGLADGVRTIYHCAGKVDIWGKKRDFFETNVNGLAALLEEAHRAGSERFVHLSSAAVHGDRLPAVAREDLPYTGLRHPYIASKVCAERMVLEAHRAGRIAATILRPVHIHGPRSQLVAEILERIRRGRRVFVSYRGGALPTLFVGNLTDAMLLAGSREEALGRAFFVTDDLRMTWNEFVAAIAETFGLVPNPRPTPANVAMVLGALYEAAYFIANSPRRPPITRYSIRMFSVDSEFSIERARRELGYRPRYDLRSALEETRRWFELKDAAG